jgi:uncharacterized membrane protein
MEDTNQLTLNSNLQTTGNPTSVVATKVKRQRLEVIDSLRGFALLAIMLLHCIEHFGFNQFPNPQSQVA